MGKDCKLTKEQCEMLDIEYETDPEVQKEMDLLLLIRNMRMK